MAKHEGIDLPDAIDRDHYTQVSCARIIYVINNVENKCVKEDHELVC